MGALRAESEIATILAAYSLLQPTVVGLCDANYRIENWLIADQDGQRYVLRRHLQHAHVRRVAFQLRFLASLP